MRKYKKLFAVIAVIEFGVAIYSAVKAQHGYELVVICATLLGVGSLVGIILIHANEKLDKRISKYTETVGQKTETKQA